MYKYKNIGYSLIITLSALGASAYFIQCSRNWATEMLSKMPNLAYRATYPITDQALLKTTFGVQEKFPDGSPVPEGHTFDGKYLECKRGIIVDVWDERDQKLTNIRNYANLPLKHSLGGTTKDGIIVYDKNGGIIGHLIFENEFLNELNGIEGLTGKRDNSELMIFVPSNRGLEARIN